MIAAAAPTVVPNVSAICGSSGSHARTLIELENAAVASSTMVRRGTSGACIEAGNGAMLTRGLQTAEGPGSAH